MKNKNEKNKYQDHLRGDEKPDELNRVSDTQSECEAIEDTSFLIDSSESESSDYHLWMIFRKNNSIDFLTQFSSFGTEFDDGHPSSGSDRESVKSVSPEIVERLYERYLPQPSKANSELERRTMLAEAIEVAQENGGIHRILSEVGYVPPDTKGTD